MRTKFITTMAAVALLTVGSTAVALAQAADTIAATNQDVISDLNQASSTPTQSNVGWSAHFHPHGHRYP